MNILLIGSGGREHALAMALQRSENCQRVIVTPGNPGMLGPEKIEITKLAEHELVQFIKENDIAYVVIGPEAPLAKGLSDELRAHGIAVFGPSKTAAQLEASKIFSKKIMATAGVKTAAFGSAHNLARAKELIDLLCDDHGIVLKADGLASGKGVVVCDTGAEAMIAAQQLFEKYDGELLIEKRLKGREVSAFYLCLGEYAIFLGEACDHKRLKDGDVGPNTGGMGAYSPAVWLGDEKRHEIKHAVIDPILKTMQQAGTPFCGILFAGLMIDAENLNVLEFNVRFGDPETQTLLPRLEWDAALALKAVAMQDVEAFKKLKIAQKKLTCVHVVKASAGYPEKPVVGQPIHNANDKSAAAQIYYAGVSGQPQNLLSDGGRVLGVSALGDTLEQARMHAYQAIELINFTGAQYRFDIGSKS